MESLFIRDSSSNEGGKTFDGVFVHPRFSSNEKRKTIDGVLFIQLLTPSERIMSETPLIVFPSLSLGEGRGEV
jgi:hypothetical protein